MDYKIDKLEAISAKKLPFLLHGSGGPMKIINTFVSVLLIMSIVITQAGCSTFVPHTQKVTIVASEPM